MDDFRFLPAGDSAMIVEFEERIDPVVNTRAIRLAEAVDAARIAGVRDIVPTFRSVAIFFDPLRVEYAQLIEFVNQHARRHIVADEDQRAPIRVPVCYGGDLGPDLPAVAEFARMSAEEVASIHA